MYGSLGVVGRHCVFELEGGDPLLLDNEDFIKNALMEAAAEANATLLSTVSHKFEPQGVTAIALLSESHISIHTWPEERYAAIDCFSCGSHTDPEAACRNLQAAFGSKSGSMQILTRKHTELSRDRSPALAL